MSDPGPGGVEGRPEHSGRPFPIAEVNPLGDPDANALKLAQMEELARFKRNQRWESSRQIFVLFWFGGGSLLFFGALLMSGTVLLTSENEVNVHIAKWVLQTLVSGLIAGFIGFWAIKSFEK